MTSVTSSSDDRRRRRVALLLAVLLLALGGAALSDYSITWDEGLGDLFFGQRYYSYFTTFDARYLDFETNPYPDGHRPDLRSSPFRFRPWEYYPFANVLGYATSELLSRGLGWLDPFDGFHAVNLLLGAILLAALLTFLWRRLGPVPALAAVLLVFTAPRFVVHLLANTKDFPETVFFSLALFAFAAALERGSSAGIVGAGVLAGAALATKANAVFLVPILVIVLVAPLPELWRGRRLRLLGACAAAGAAGLLVFFGSWPYLWAEPLARLAQHTRYVGQQILQVRSESVLDPLLALCGTTPLPLLTLALLGLGVALARARRDRLALLALAWTAVTLGRLYLPGAVNFDGVRHFLEIYPALGLLAALAASLAWPRENGRSLPQVYSGEGPRRGPRRLRRQVVGALLSLALVLHVGILARVHPFELAYWNALVGGSAGAHQRGIPQAGDYWALSYRQGLRWLNENAPEGAVLAVPVAQHSVLLTAQSRLRRDLGLLDLSIPTRPEIPPAAIDRIRRLSAERPVYVMFVPRADWTNALMEDCRRRLEPVKVWSLDGVAILEIYRYQGS
jgi:hypothetical protein